MRFQEQEAKMLNAVLLSAYTYQSLERMLFFALGKHLQHIAPPQGDLQQVVFSVLSTAQLEGWTNDLVYAAHDANPGNPKLKAFVDQYMRFRGAAPSLEKIIQRANSFLDVATWRTKLERIERQVCSIEIAGDHTGTGFLIDHDLVMTNYHVIEDLIGHAPQFKPQQVQLRFDFKKSEDGTVLNDGIRYALAHDMWLVDHSRYSDAEANNNFDATPKLNELDYAVLRLAPLKTLETDTASTPGNEPIQGSHDKHRGWVGFSLPESSLIPDAALFIVQHPDGKPLKMALATNSIIGLNDNGTRLRHQTNTEPGSSGAACFDSNWTLVALHQSGDPRWRAPAWNQAVPIKAIRDWWHESDKLSAILDETIPSAPVTAGAEADYLPEDEADEMLQ